MIIGSHGTFSSAWPQRYLKLPLIQFSSRAHSASVHQRHNPELSDCRGRCSRSTLPCIYCPFVRLPPRTCSSGRSADRVWRCTGSRFLRHVCSMRNPLDKFIRCRGVGVDWTPCLDDLVLRTPCLQRLDLCLESLDLDEVLSGTVSELLGLRLVRLLQTLAVRLYLLPLQLDPINPSPQRPPSLVVYIVLLRLVFPRATLRTSCVLVFSASSKRATSTAFSARIFRSSY